MNLHRFVIATCILAFIVIVLGAYTRLTDAGLGCPDWPGCYGKLIVPPSEEHVTQKHYLEQRALEPEKGWMEMIHRYSAGALGLIILAVILVVVGVQVWVVGIVADPGVLDTHTARIDWGDGTGPLTVTVTQTRVSAI